MIKIENTEVFGFDAAIRGMRNPKNSWAKSDSFWEHIENPQTMNTAKFQFHLGEADFDLMKRLASACNDHGKFMRMINVTCDITAPTFWVAELDTYKVGTVRNSCSLQHKGASKPFTIRDFTVPEEVYEILDPIKNKRDHKLTYLACEAEDYKIYSVGDREYKIFRNGKIVSCAYEREHEADNRTRKFAEREVIPSQTAHGYYEINLGGRKYNERWLLHRLVAKVWLGDSFGLEVNHIDGNKGNNSVENLEWVTHSENEKHKHLNNLDGRTLHTNYIAWKNATKFSSEIKRSVLNDYEKGMRQKDLSEKYKISQSTISTIIRKDFSENSFLFEYAQCWERLLSCLNSLREMYLTTGDYDYFRAMREFLPMGYNYRFTWAANYQVLKNIYHSRKNHPLVEWHDFCKWIESLPYSELITNK